MKLTKENVCVYIEDEAQLEKAREILEKYGEDVDNTMFRIPTFDGCNKLSKWIIDGNWRVHNSQRQEITLEQLEEILKGEKDGSEE